VTLASPSNSEAERAELDVLFGGGIDEFADLLHAGVDFVGTVLGLCCR
jgi:hypothetical protein